MCSYVVQSTVHALLVDVYACLLIPNEFFLNQTTNKFNASVHLTVDSEGR